MMQTSMQSNGFILYYLFTQLRDSVSDEIATVDQFFCFLFV